MSKPFQVGELVRLHKKYFSAFRRLYVIQKDQIFFIADSFKTSAYRTTWVVPGLGGCRTSQLRHVRMLKKDRDALYAKLFSEDAALNLFASDIPAAVTGEPFAVPPSSGDDCYSAPGAGGDPGTFINELSTPFSPEEHGIGDAINNGGPQWPQER